VSLAIAERTPLVEPDAMERRLQRPRQDARRATALAPSADVHETEDEPVVDTLRERLERRFERRFVLPAEADVEHPTATFAVGVLAIRAPKAKKAIPKKIAITTA
jgi:HSP20 family molecular chaperone IbpA